MGIHFLRIHRVNWIAKKLPEKMMLLVLAFLPVMMSRPVLEELVWSKVEETMDAINGSKVLCPNGSSYCEEVDNYPYKAILAAIRNQSDLVNTPGLWDSPMEENVDDMVEELEENSDEKEDEFELYDNGIVPY